MRYLVAICIFLALAPGSPLRAEPVRLAVPSTVEESGLLKYLLPRFSLKTSIRISVGEAPAEVVIGADGAALMRDEGVVYRVTATSERKEVIRFRDWLLSDVGQRTIFAYKRDGVAIFSKPDSEIDEVVAVAPTGDIGLGEKLSLQHCGRCHVVSDRNRFAGIGSTPSFMALRTLPAWQDRFAAFWTLNPHPSFTQVEDMTEPFDPERPPAIAPILLTLEEAEAIAAFAATVPPANLGADVQAN